MHAAMLCQPLTQDQRPHKTGPGTFPFSFLSSCTFRRVTCTTIAAHESDTYDYIKCAHAYLLVRLPHSCMLPGLLNRDMDEESGNRGYNMSNPELHYAQQTSIRFLEV